MSGYVRLHRQLLSHPAFRNDAEALAFAWMFARAAWKSGRVRYKGHAVDLNRGQLAISIRDMADAMDRDKAWIERLFKRLRAETMIETQTVSGVSVVTICNYDKFQPLKDTHEAEGETPNEIDARQTRDTDKEREEDKKITNTARPARARGFEIPDWVPAEPWAAFVEMRKQIGHKLTDHGKKLAIGELEKLCRAGSDAAAVLNQSTMKSWRGLFAACEPVSPPEPVSEWTPERRAAHLAKMERLGGGASPPSPPERREASSHGKPIGQLIQFNRDAA